MRILSVLAAVFLSLFLSACSPDHPSYPHRRPPEGYLNDPGHISAGRDLFRHHCRGCHGTPEETQGSTPDLDPPAPRFKARKYAEADPAYLFWRIEKGKTVEPYRSRGSAMPAFGPHFSEEQIWKLVAYLRARPDS